jgi:voltage-gated potassium channel
MKLGKLEAYIQELHVNPVLVDVVKLIMQIFVVAHIVACLWYSVADYDLDPHEPSWINSNPLDDEFKNSTIKDRYVVSFYWTITTMLSIGYGDFSAQNTSEYIFSIVVMILGGISFGAVIAQTTRLIESRNPQAKAFKLKMDELKSYLEEKTLPDFVKYEAKDAYTYYFGKKSSLAETGLLDDVPKHMLNKLISHIYWKEKEVVKLFRTFDENFVVQIVTKSNPFQVKAGDLVYSAGDIADEIYFICRGSVRFTMHDGVNDVVCGYIREGGYFGDFEYFKHTTRLCDHYAAHECNVLSIKYDIFDMASDSNVEEGVRFMLETRRRYEVFSRLKSDERNKAIVLVDQDAIDDDDDPNHDALHKATEKLRHNVSAAAIENYKKLVRQSGGVIVRERIWVDGFEQKSSTRLDLGRDVDDRSTKRMERIMFLNALGLVEIAEEFPWQIERRGLIYHKSAKKSWWDGIIGVLIVYSTISIPVVIGFDMFSDTTFVFDNVVDLLFGLDILACMWTTYRDEVEEAIVVEKSVIRTHYYKTWFFVDFFSWFPFDTIVELFAASNNEIALTRLLKTLRLVRLLKLARLVKLAKYMNAVEDRTGISPHTFDLIKLTIEVVFIGHMIACLWWYYSINMSPGNSWWDYHVAGKEELFASLGREYPEPDLNEKYLTVLYWTITTLSTVGYGDISPHNTSERILSILIMIVGASVFGYIVANVSTLMSSLNEASARVNERVSEVSEYLYERQCPDILSAGIVKHLKHLFSMESSFDETEILSRLPGQLRKKLLMIQHKETLDKIPIFRYVKNDSVVIYLFEKMHAYYYSANEDIITQGVVATEILFITNGSCIVYKDTPLSKLAGFRKPMPVRMRRPEIKPGQMVDDHRRVKSRAAKVSDKRSIKDHVLGVWDRFGVGGSSFSKYKVAAGNTTKIKGRKGLKGLHAMGSQHSLNRHEARNKSDMLFSNGHAGKIPGFNSETKKVGVLGAGDFVGHLALMKGSKTLNRDKHITSVRAQNLVSVFGLSKFDIPQIIRDQPTVALQLQIALGTAIEHNTLAVRKLSARTKKREFFGEIRTKWESVSGAQQKREPVRPSSVSGKAMQAIRLVAAPVSTGVGAIHGHPSAKRKPIPERGSIRESLSVSQKEGGVSAIVELKKKRAQHRWDLLRREVRTAARYAYTMHAMNLRRQQMSVLMGRMPSPYNPSLDRNEEEEARLDAEHALHSAQLECMRDPPPRIPKYALRSVFREHFSEKLGMLDTKNDDDFTKHWITSHVRLKHRYGNTGLGVGRLHQSCPNLHSIVVKVPEVLPKKTDSGSDVDSDNSDSDSDNEKDESNQNASQTDGGGLKRRQSFPSLDNNEWMAEYGNFL